MDVNMTDKDGQTALHLAAAEKEVEGGALLVLLAFQANVYVADSKKWTPLHVACNVGKCFGRKPIPAWCIFVHTHTRDPTLIFFCLLPRQLESL